MTAQLDLIDSLERDDVTLFLCAMHGFTDTKRMSLVLDQILETNAPQILACLLQDCPLERIPLLRQIAVKKYQLPVPFVFIRHNLPEMLLAWLDFAPRDVQLCLPDQTTLILFACLSFADQTIPSARSPTCINSWAKTLKQLIRRNAPVFCTMTEDLSTPFHLLARHAPCNPLFQALMTAPESKFHLLVPNDNDLTPLALAVQGLNFALVDSLLSVLDYSLNSLNREHETVSDLVIRTGCVEYLERLLQRFDCDLLRVINPSALSYNCTILFFKGHMDMISFLFREGVTLSQQTIAAMIYDTIRFKRLQPRLEAVLALPLILVPQQIKEYMTTDRRGNQVPLGQLIKSCPRVLALLKHHSLFQRQALLSLVE